MNSTQQQCIYKNHEYIKLVNQWLLCLQSSYVHFFQVDQSETPAKEKWILKCNNTLYQPHTVSSNIYINANNNKSTVSKDTV